ncbi:MAG: hypothetical protein QOI66_1575 [Myxococcales bacterium]|nr:hypothetical protein [Myxococcales bacterium]
MEQGQLTAAWQRLVPALNLAAQSADLVLTAADLFVAQGKLREAGAVLEQGRLHLPSNAAISLRLLRQLSQIVARVDERARQATGTSRTL